METAQYIAMMISRDQLTAAMAQNSDDPRTWVLRFAGSSNTRPLSEQQQYQELQEQLAKTARLAEYVRESDRKLSLNKEYINLLKQKTDSVAPASAAEDLTVPGHFEDEDIMGDV